MSQIINITTKFNEISVSNDITYNVTSQSLTINITNNLSDIPISPITSTQIETNTSPLTPTPMHNIQSIQNRRMSLNIDHNTNTNSDSDSGSDNYQVEYTPSADILSPVVDWTRVLDVNILDNLKPEELIALKNVSVHQSTKAYMETKFNIKTYIAPFITNISRFLEIIKDSSTSNRLNRKKDIYISGSVVMQAIMGKTFNMDNISNNSMDMDIYVTSRDAPKYAVVVKEDKYLFKMLKFLIEEEHYTNTVTQFTGVCSINTYFKLVKGNKKIDIIIESNSIKQVLSKFYAVHTMNYYDPTADKIYSVRPTALVNKVSHICDYFLREYRENYNIDFDNEFSPRSIMDNPLPIDTITDEIRHDNPSRSNRFEDQYRGPPVRDELIRHSEYFKFKKIEAVLKYRSRGFTFKDWSHINTHMAPYEYKFNSHQYIHFNNYGLVAAFREVLWTFGN